VNKVLAGSLAGALATAPMTVAMSVVHRALPERERYPLPPKEITEELTEEVGVRGGLEEPELNALTMLAHFGYGAAAGGLYALVRGALPGSPPAKGVFFGLGVWTGSYLGLLPLARILSPATEHPPRRNALMIAAHVVWGGGLGLLEGRLRRERGAWLSREHERPSSRR